MSDCPITALMAEIAEYAMRHGHKASCQFKVDDNWDIAISAKEEMKCGGGKLMEVTLKPFHFAVWWNGWLAGIGNPFGGVIAAGQGANETTLMEALKR